MTDNYGEMCLETLMELRKDYLNRIQLLSIQKVANEAQAETANLIGDYKAQLAAIDAALIGKEPKNRSMEESSYGGSDGYFAINYGNRVRDSVKELGRYKPGTPIETYITKLENIYRIQVEPEKTNYPNLEPEFVRFVTLMLPPSAAQKFTELKNWEEVKTQLINRFQVKLSMFQMLSKCWSFTSNDDYITSANKLKGIMDTAKVHILRTFREETKKEMTADNVFSLMSAMIMAENIKTNDGAVYNRLIDVLDKCFDPEAVAAKAAFYKNRICNDSGASTFYGGSGQTKSNGSKKSDNKKPKKKKNTEDKRTPEEKAREEAIAKRCISEKFCIKFNLNKTCTKDPCPYVHRLLDDPTDPVSLFNEGFQ